MKAVVFHGIGDIRLDDVPDPQLQQPADALVRFTSSAICGTDLHMVRGTLGEMESDTILGHERAGYIARCDTANAYREFDRREPG
ncbi:threonine dehydrogenase-like Zn-dependent dehydrogenase [Paraburkholderia sp. WSM4177]|nr:MULTISPECIES: alcohol dehydrogenase catalytic domain-containing protein [unclassified Paraburkholderia]MBB5447672.1 threonine dehydrogenase-like Zn-dependent dehydrogenase [Paraburkholderia sp. WSM4177]